MTIQYRGTQSPDWVPHRSEGFVGGLGEIVERRRGGLLEIGLHTADSHRNLSGIVHGGVMMTLIDRTIGINCREAAAGERMATASLTVNFMRQARVGDFIEVRCTLRKEGRKVIFADAFVYVGDKLIGGGTGVFMKVA